MGFKILFKSSVVGVLFCLMLILNLVCSIGPEKLDKVGLQLYTLGTDVEDIETTLMQLKEAGYDQVEFFGPLYEKTSQEMKEILDRVGLTSPATHARNLDSEEGLAQSIEDALIIGHEYLIMPVLPGLNYAPMGERPEEEEEETIISMEDVNDYVELLNSIGQACQDAGLDFLFHNHQPDFAETENGDILYDLLIEMTDPELVNFEMDLGWTIAAGADPLVYFEKYPGRFPVFHVKDITVDNQACVVGEGTIDFATIFSKSEQAGAKYYFVEQDGAPEPMANVTASVQYLKNMEF